MVATMIGCDKAAEPEKELIISDASLQEEGKTLAPTSIPTARTTSC